MTEPSLYEKQLARLVQAGQFPEALEFARAHQPTRDSAFGYLLLSCHAALGTGELGYAKLWLTQWLQSHPNHPGALRLAVSTLIEDADQAGAVEHLKRLVRAEPSAPERLELVRHLASTDRSSATIEWIESAPNLTVELALIAHELTTKSGPRNLETPWLERARNLDPTAPALILAAYKLEPTEERAHEQITQLLTRENALEEVEVITAGLRIIAEHPSIPSQKFVKALERIDASIPHDFLLEVSFIWLNFKNEERAERLLLRFLEKEKAHKVASLVLSKLYLGQGKSESALKVLTDIPRDDLFGSADLVQQLAEVGVELRRYEIALAAQQVLVKHQPHNLQHQIRLAQLLNFNGLCKEELEIYETCLKNPETRMQALLLKTFSTPPFYNTESEITAARTRVEDNLPLFREEARRELKQDARALHLMLSTHTNFSLGYQQENDRKIQESFGEILHETNDALFGSKAQTTGTGAKPQITFYSHFIWNHTVGKLFHRWMTGLTQAGFDVAVVSSHAETDSMTQKIQESVTHFEMVGHDVAASIKALRKLHTDILIFPELGMDSIAISVASVRNAPLQCMAWGHPITSGLPTMDVFLTSDLMEPNDGQNHYSEKLIKLPGLSVEYEAPTLPERPFTRTELGLPEDRTLILSCQTLYKLLPRYDEAYIDILRRSPAADLVFIANRSRYITEQFRLRMSKAMTSAGLHPERLHLVGPLPHPAYLSLNMVCDIFLDSPGWSGGNTTLESLRTHLPIVTMPGEFMRGCHSAAILKRLGLSHLIAHSLEEWTDRAVVYSNDNVIRREHAELIVSNADKAYRDPRIVEALGQRLQALHPRAR